MERQLTSGLGRRLYSLPDDDSVVNARKSLAADPKNVERDLQLSKAEAARRQYKEAVATSTEGLAFAPKNADLYLVVKSGVIGRTLDTRGSSELPLDDLEQATQLAPEMFVGNAHYITSGWRTTILSSPSSMKQRHRSTKRERWRETTTA